MVGKLDWNVQVWLCRRFLRKMTVRKVAVLAHVTGWPPAQIINMHPDVQHVGHKLAA